VKPEIHEEEFAVMLPPLQKKLLSGFVGFEQTKTLSLFFHNKWEDRMEKMQVERMAEFPKSRKI